jgi:hypothetical protein
MTRRPSSAAAASLRPSDQGVVERAAAGLKGLGRHGELLELYERGAEALGGTQAAQWLLEAAGLAADQLDDAARAQELKLRAGRMDPNNPIALRASPTTRGDPGGRRGERWRGVSNPDEDRRRRRLSWPR